MKIGANCFKDEQMRSMIETQNAIGNCDITGLVDCLIYNTEDGDNYLEEYFEEILDVFTPINKIFKYAPKDKTGFLKTFLFNWDIFNVDENEIGRILVEICKDRYMFDKDLFEEKVGIRESFNIDYLEKNCLLRNYSWNDFCSYIKYKNRYYSKHINAIQLKQLLENMKYSFLAGELTLYRSRIGTKDGFLIRDLGAPPIEKISPGRINSEGIQCLYLSGDIETTFHEIRARELDYISAGKFELIDDITIVDLSLFDEIGPFSYGDFDMVWFAINIGIIRNIGNEIAKPLRRYNSPLEYVPTQYISDFIKYLGYDGIKYKSSLHDDGVNYAIFDEEKFKCTSVEVYHIEKLQYKKFPC